MATLVPTIYPLICYRPDLHGSTGHLATSLGAPAASLCATLTVVHFMRTALCRAPIADVSTHRADLLREGTIAGDRVGAQPADFRALDATGRTGIFAFHACHVRETGSAFSRALVASGDAVLGTLIQLMTHFVFPWLDNCRSAVAGPLIASFLFEEE